MLLDKAQTKVKNDERGCDDSGPEKIVVRKPKWNPMPHWSGLCSNARPLNPTIYQGRCMQVAEPWG